MTKAFENRTALITGAAKGIGRACALRLASEGAKVILTDIDGEGLARTAGELTASGAAVLSEVCDVSDESAVARTVNKALEAFGAVDVLINNAALWRDVSEFVKMDFSLWKKYFDVNVMGTVHFTRAVLDRMIENRYGRIVNVGSVAGVYGNRKMAHYSATKGAVIAFTKALAKEVAGYGITVNCVSPGTVSPSDDPDQDHTIPSQLSYMGRTGSDRENAGLICFLAQEGSGYISGQNVQIDGCRKMI